MSPIGREELKMFYKHWKKISLAITGFFWASCDSGTTTEPPLYGAPPQYSSSSEIQNSSSSSEDKISSSSEPLPMPAYGVPQMDCEVTSENDSTVTCENGYTCIAKTDTIHRQRSLLRWRLRYRHYTRRTYTGLSRLRHSVLPRKILRMQRRNRLRR